MKDTKKTLNRSHFRFINSGHGLYYVTYTFTNGKQISCAVNDMELIDATKNAESPKLKDLLILKHLIKSNQ
jgi:hypothetical protein